MKEKISIVLPVYNEARVISQIINQIKKVMHSLNYEIIAVDDGSKDATGRILDNIKGIKVIHHSKNKGYGSSIKTGIKFSSGKWILIVDSDGTYPIEDIPKLIKYTGRYDMVVGAREGKEVYVPFLRKPAKGILQLISSYVAGKRIRDLNSGMRIFKKEIALRFWNLFPKGFSFTTTLTLACLTNEYDVKFVKINYYMRKGKSSIKPLDLISFFKLILKIMLFFRPLRFFIPLGFLMFLLAFLVLYASILYTQKIPDTTIAIIAMFGLQTIILGILAELIVRKDGGGSHERR